MKGKLFMKKIFLILLSLCLVCSGCSGYKKSSAVTAVTSGLSFTAKLSYDGKNYNYSVKIDKNGTTEIKNISANEKTGTDYIFENGTVTYKYNKLSYKTNISDIPQSSVADFIYTVFKETESKRNNVSYKNEEYYIKGETDKYKFTVYLGETGLPIKITDTKMDVLVIITESTLL